MSPCNNKETCEEITVRGSPCSATNQRTQVTQERDFWEATPWLHNGLLREVHPTPSLSIFRRQFYLRLNLTDSVPGSVGQKHSRIQLIFHGEYNPMQDRKDLRSLICQENFCLIMIKVQLVHHGKNIWKKMAFLILHF